MDTLTHPDQVTLSAAELQEITGYALASRQLNILHQRGFVRAYRSRSGRIVLERSHYLAVCRGEFASQSNTLNAPAVNLAFLKQHL